MGLAADLVHAEIELGWRRNITRHTVTRYAVYVNANIRQVTVHTDPQYRHNMRPGFEVRSKVWEEDTILR